MTIDPAVVDGVEEHVRSMLIKLVPADHDTEHLRGTPKRVAEMYKELLSGYQDPYFKVTTFEAIGDSMIVQRDIPFYSLCSHHLIPFFGTVCIGYVPGKLMIGLSKFARIVKHFSARLQVQEQLTKDVLECLKEALRPKGVMVVVRARHLCQEMRGIRTPAETITSAIHGVFLDVPSAKKEFLSIIGGA